MEPLPELKNLSDEELKELIDRLEREESDVSYRRRLLQGRIDILRAERTARMKRSVDSGESAIADVETLTDILAHKGPPPADEPQA